jgi:glycosyltransferase involved in cell wall biosynthesis
MKRIIILMPVYEDRDSAAQLCKELVKHLGNELYIVAVDDGSVNTPMLADIISGAGAKGEVIYLKRNLGHQRALATGLTHIANTQEYDAVVVMDSDGEDRPETITPLIETLENEKVDAVVAWRRSRIESIRFKLFYVVYRYLFRLLTGKQIQFGNFIALSKMAVKRITAMQELWLHFAASLMVSRVRLGRVPTDRGKRYHGTSQMNFVSLALHGLRSVMVFAEDVLVRVGIVCTALAFFSLLALASAVILKLIGFATPGWFSTASGILILILLQTGTLTLVTLMIAGILRGKPPETQPNIESLVDRVEHAK